MIEDKDYTKINNDRRIKNIQYRIEDKGMTISQSYEIGPITEKLTHHSTTIDYAFTEKKSKEKMLFMLQFKPSIEHFQQMIHLGIL